MSLKDVPSCRLEKEGAIFPDMKRIKGTGECIRDGVNG
jgi:hypothetical protein